MARRTRNIVEEIYLMLRGVNPDGLSSALDQLADPEITDRDGRTVLINAAFCGRMDIVQYMIARGANINAADNNGFTALHAAVLEQNIPLIEYLLAQGANIHARNAFGNNVLMLPRNDAPKELWELLLSHGADPYAKNNYGISAADLWQMGNGPNLLKGYL